MGGKSGTTTQQVQIPPEVLARYNAVNERAQDVASTPFQKYSNDPSSFVAPINQQQQAGIANVNQAANMTQPYFGTATQYLQQGQQTAQPYYDYATKQLTQGTQAGTAGTAAAMDPMLAAAQQAQGLQGSALNQYQSAVAGAQPYNAAATQAITGGYQAAQPLNASAARNIYGAQANAQPFQELATAYGLAGAQAVDPGNLGSEQINRYMSPYMQDVVQSTLAPLRQQQQQEQSTLIGNQIAQGAFGGDRGRIAQANLARQQEMATAKTAADLLQSGYGQALQTAQQQQQLGLGAAQANRAAQQQAAQQMLGIGSQGFGQGMTTAQQQAALGQQLYGQGLGAGQALAGVGQQQYGQLAGTGQNLAALGQQTYGQGLGESQQRAALAQQMYGMGAGSAQQAAALGQGQYGMGATTAQQLAALGSGAQASMLQGAQAQIGAGTLQQQTEQAGKQAMYNQFLQEQGYPFQVAQFLANIAMGTGALSGSGQVTNQPMPFLSDRRAKEDIKKIGKTYDGQPIYSFRYKGEPGTQIGLLAQEVEKKHPDAVGLAGHLKTVDYEKATAPAAERGHFYQGGLVADADGGAVIPAGPRLGFANGSAVSPGDLEAIMQAQRQALGLYGGEEHPGLGKSIGSTPGATRNVPAASLATPALITPGPAPEIKDNSAEALQAVQQIAGAYSKLKHKDDTPKPDAKTRDALDGTEDYAAENAGGLVRGGYALGGDPASPEKEKTANDITPGLGANEQKDVPTELPGLSDSVKQSQSKPQLQRPTSVQQPQDNTLATIGTIASIAAMFMASDKRLKENIEPIGETFDGQKVYKYNYKGDPSTRMGLIAQEVERDHPDAVGLAGGYRTVNYAKATEEAANRGHFYDGGLARRGYATPGAVTDETSGDGASAHDDVPQQSIRGDIVRAPVPVARPRANKQPAGLAATTDPMELLRQQARSERVYADPGEMANVSPTISETPEGLGAATNGFQPVVNFNTSKRKPGLLGQYFQDLKSGKEEAVVPLISGLGAMLAGPSYTWGQAIGKGLLGGVSAYQPTRQRILERAQTQAETTGRQADTMRALGITPDSGRFIPYASHTPGGPTHFDKLQQKPISFEEYQRELAKGAQFVYGSLTNVPGYSGVTSNFTDQGSSTPSVPTPPNAEAASQPRPVTLRLGAKEPEAQDIEREFGRDSLIQSQAGNMPSGTAAEVQAWNARAVQAQQNAQKSKQQMDESVSNFNPQFSNSMANLTKSAELLKSTDLNAASDTFANWIGLALSVPGIRALVPEAWKEYQEARDYTKKAAALQAMSQAGVMINGAPASSLATALLTVADTSLNPGAKRDVIQQTMAQMLREKALNDAYSKYRGQIADVEKFKQRFYQDNPLEVFAKQANDMLPIFKGQSAAAVARANKPATSNASSGTNLTAADIAAMKNNELPQGTTRMIGGVRRSWDGKQWNFVKN